MGDSSNGGAKVIEKSDMTKEFAIYFFSIDYA
jgi:hypothetical protein